MTLKLVSCIEEADAGTKTILAVIYQSRDNVLYNLSIYRCINFLYHPQLSSSEMSEQPAIAPKLVQASLSDIFHSPNSTATKLVLDLYDWNIVTLFSTVIAILGISALWFSRYKRFKDLPRGPWGYPILGEP